MSDPRQPASSESAAASDTFLASVQEALDRVPALAEPAVVFEAILERFAARGQAPRASLLLLNPASGRLRVAAAIGLPDELVGQDVPVHSRSIADWVYRSRRGVILDGEVRDTRFEGSAPRAGIGSAMCVPVLAEGGILGVLNLARIPPAPAFTNVEMAALERELRLAALRIERTVAVAAAEAQRRRLEAFVAGAPMSRVPRGASEAGALQVAWAHVPGLRIGGDLCDRTPHSGGGHYFMVSDVPGQGDVTITLAALVQGLFLGLANADRSPWEIATRMSAELHARTGGIGVAAWIALVSPNGQTLSCNAGYHPPLWLPADGGDPHPLDTGGPVLGAMPSPSYEQELLQLLPGDTLLAASDGIVAARDNQERAFGLPALIEVVAEHHKGSLERLVESVCAAAASHAAHSRPIDDLAALALRFTRED